MISMGTLSGLKTENCHRKGNLQPFNENKIGEENGNNATTEGDPPPGRLYTLKKEEHEQKRGKQEPRNIQEIAKGC
jgi:hypothetical protein